MAEQTVPRDGQFETVIGPDARFKGELTFEKNVKIQGRLEGTIESPGRLLVCQEGKVKADIKAASIAVDGEIKGNVEANDRLELRSTARLSGDIRAKKLMVAEGAVLIGNCHVGADDGSAKPTAKPQVAAAATPAAAPAKR
jgi:cytoskeletal protein CcmA (bactofilin family)